MPKNTPPNILFILTDQQRWDSLGCYNTPGVHTPNLDRLAEEGVRYNLWHDPAHREIRDQLWVKLTNWLVLQESQGRARGTHARPSGFLEKRGVDENS